jgi:hypothetical protein
MTLETITDNIFKFRDILSGTADLRSYRVNMFRRLDLLHSMFDLLLLFISYLGWLYVILCNHIDRITKGNTAVICCISNFTYFNFVGNERVEVRSLNDETLDLLKHLHTTIDDFHNFVTLFAKEHARVVLRKHADPRPLGTGRPLFEVVG